MLRDRVRVASAQYRIEALGTWEALEGKLTGLCEQAAHEGARLLLFPEYAALELVNLVEQRSTERRSPERHLLGPLPVQSGDRRQSSSLFWATDAIQALLPRYLSLHAALAARLRTHIVAGSAPVRHHDGSITNTAYFFSPDGTVGSQDKMILTRWEREVWQMRSGEDVHVFDTDFGRVGITICYDVEFPVIARRQAEAGARVILVPCCCDSLRGYYRVRVGAQARALENQAYVIQSPVIGVSDWLPAIGRCAGLAGIYVAPDLGPHENGVVAQAANDTPQWLYAELDLAAIDRIRGNAPIANIEDWTAHVAIGAATVGSRRRVA